MNDIIDKLNELDLHDSPVEKLEIKFEEKRVELWYYLWDETNDEYTKHRLIFSGVRNIFFDGLTLDDDFDVQEILECNCVKHKEFYKCELIFYTGTGKPVLTVVIVFNSINFDKPN